MFHAFLPANGLVSPPSLNNLFSDSCTGCKLFFAKAGAQLKLFEAAKFSPLFPFKQKAP